MTTTLKIIETTEAAVEAIESIKGKIANSPTGVSFFGVREYTNKAGETSNYTINIGVNYAKSKAADLAFLKGLDVMTLTGLKSNSVDLLAAQTALIASLEKEAGETNHSSGQIEAYDIIAPNVKRHKETGLLYITGSKTNKKVLVEGTYKTVKSSSLTIAKNELRKMLKTSKIRQFILDTSTMKYEVVYTVDTTVYGGESNEVEA